MAFRPEDIGFVDIFPPINVARVGDSDEHYLGPEIPGVEPRPDGGFKDSQHRIKRQAARFRVYAYGKDGKVLGEVCDSTGYELTWKVHVANKKSAWVLFRGQYREETMELRNPTVEGWPDNVPGEYAYTDTRKKLIIDSGEQVVTGIRANPVDLKGNFHGSHEDHPATEVHLGNIRTDEEGRLVVVAGDGHSYYIYGPPDRELLGEFDNDDWVDSMCDGNVRVAVKSREFPYLDIKVQNKATIITAPPKFTNGLHCPSSLLDLIDDVYERQRRGPGYDVGDVDFYRHIQPMFRTMYNNSWTNFRANEGHGPRKAQYFLDNPDLSNPKAGPEADKIRKYILDRIRAPVKKGDKENEALRDTQAYMYYMPRLGGNDSDMPEGSKDENNRDRWSSLTELQYDRLKKWASGTFTTGEPKAPYASFDKIPLQEQPDALTHSAIEWSVGAPLYPGIEVYWIAEFDHIYNPKEKYRFAETVQPGDLGKGLSLPWQADFFMCNTHWWPSVRPDNIVTEEHFFQTTQSFKEEPMKIALNLTKRVRWDDGLNRHPTDEKVGSSEMVRKWTKLGFIAHQPYDPKINSLPVFIEKERNPTFPHTD